MRDAFDMGEIMGGLYGNGWVIAVSEAVLGPDYKIVEIGFDVPKPGAMYRDFPAPDETLVGRRLNSLAFNLTRVDVIPSIVGTCART